MREPVVTVFMLCLLTALLLTSASAGVVGAHPEQVEAVQAPGGEDKSATGHRFCGIVAVDTGEVKTLLEENAKNSDVVILDVSTRRSFARGHLPGAVPLSAKDPDFAVKIAGLDKSKTYLVYCQGGTGVLKARRLMEEHGFSRVFVYLEGVPAWKRAGYPLVR